MRFIEKFKIGDVICSDRFNNKKMMVVEEVVKKGSESEDYFHRDGYRCMDLFDTAQQWRAYAYCSYTTETYNWRLATDTDYIDALVSYINPSVVRLCQKTVMLSEDGLSISTSQDYVYMDITDTKKLKDYLNNWIL